MIDFDVEEVSSASSHMTFPVLTTLKEDKESHVQYSFTILSDVVDLISMLYPVEAYAWRYDEPNNISSSK